MSSNASQAPNAEKFEDYPNLAGPPEKRRECGKAVAGPPSVLQDLEMVASTPVINPELLAITLCGSSGRRYFRWRLHTEREKC